MVPIRGIVPGGLARTTKGGLDAVVLAVAGLNRLGLSATVTCLNGFHQLTAAGQGP
ncbi:hypothetical protein ABZ847_06550 [Streptomyces bauhiniae]